MQRLDGNVLAGPLSAVMQGDVTSAMGRCVHCDDTAAVAQAVVFAEDGRFVVRCRRCDEVLMTVTESREGVLLTMSGIADFRMPSA